MIKIPSRKDIGRRTRKKTLQKVIADKAENPEKYAHEMSEYDLYLRLDWDFKHGQLCLGKLPLYEKLKEKYGGKK